MVHSNHLQLENLDSDSESSVSEKLNDKSSSQSPLSSPSTSPKLVSTHRFNFQGVIKSEKDYEDLHIQMTVPRTVPCIVLSPNNEMNKQSVYSNPILQMISPLDSIMTKISKLSNPSSFVRGNVNNNGIWEQSERHHENNLRESVELYDSMKQLVRNSQIRIDGSPSEESINNRKSPKYETKEDLKETISNKLSFGIDRILANEKSDEEKSDESKPFLPLLTKAHQDFHPRYVNQCSECYLFSRFCYKYTLPPRSSPSSGLCQSSPNCSSWNTTPHFYEPNSQILLPSNGYGHTSLAAYSQNNSTNYNGISSIVSCNTNGNGRRKRSWSRAVFSNLQRKGLEKRFQIQKYITKPDRRQLASTLGLTDAQVKVWFQNRRMKWRHTKEGKSGDVVVGTTLNPTTPAVTPTTASSQDKK